MNDPIPIYNQSRLLKVLPVKTVLAGVGTVGINVIIIVKTLLAFNLYLDCHNEYSCKCYKITVEI